MAISCVPRYFTTFHSSGPERMAVGQKPSRSKQKCLFEYFYPNLFFFFLLIMQSIFAIASLPADSCAWLEFVKRVPRKILTICLLQRKKKKKKKKREITFKSIQSIKIFLVSEFKWKGIVNSRLVRYYTRYRLI